MNVRAIVGQYDDVRLATPSSADKDRRPSNVHRVQRTEGWLRSSHPLKSGAGDRSRDPGSISRQSLCTNEHGDLAWFDSTVGLRLCSNSSGENPHTHIHPGRRRGGRDS
jgi:hypothetical protein